jgi:ATP-dependent DNA ligase
MLGTKHFSAKQSQHDRALQFLVRPKKYNLNPHLVRQSTEVVEGFTGQCHEAASHESRTNGCATIGTRAALLCRYDEETRASRLIDDALNPYVADPAVAILAYLPKRGMAAAAAASPRDLTLPAGFIPPCSPMTAPAVPSGRLWLHEIKHDGFRIIARKDGQR